MNQKIKISEIFESIQGEGKFTGTPMLFIRTSGCTRNCPWCDTKYHIRGKNLTLKQLQRKIKESKMDYICWTGGEPLIWKKQILKVINKTKDKYHHLETNGDLIKIDDMIDFDYIAISPKELKITKIINRFTEGFSNIDIKIVTDLKKIGKDMLEYATILQPLSMENSKLDKEIRQKVWNYCVKHNIKYSGRLHIDVWGLKTKGR